LNLSAGQRRWPSDKGLRQEFVIFVTLSWGMRGDSVFGVTVPQGPSATPYRGYRGPHRIPLS